MAEKTPVTASTTALADLEISAPKNNADNYAQQAAFERDILALKAGGEPKTWDVTADTTPRGIKLSITYACKRLVESGKLTPAQVDAIVVVDAKATKRGGIPVVAAYIPAPTK